VHWDANTSAFRRRCILPGCVAPRLDTLSIRPRRALPGGRIDAFCASTYLRSSTLVVRKLLCRAVILLFVPLGAQALGLGGITVKSVLNQKLDARIELVSLQAGDLEGMRVGLADEKAFANAGVDRLYLLSLLRFEAVAGDAGRGHIRVTSQQRIREPLLNFLVEVEWSRGRVVREFSILLQQP